MSKVLKFPEKFNTESPINAENSIGCETFSDQQYHGPKNVSRSTESLNAAHFDVPDVSLAELKKRYPSEYNSWRNMRYQRCGKGGYVCHPDLATFPGFLRAFGPKPDPSYTLDRIDPTNPEYGPGLCRWASKQLQTENRTTTRYLTDANGLRLSIPEWSRRLGIDGATLRNRVDNLGWSEAEAVQSIARTPGTGKRHAPVDAGNVDMHVDMRKFQRAYQQVVVSGNLQAPGLLAKLVTAYVDENPGALNVEPDGWHLSVDDIIDFAMAALRHALLEEIRGTRKALLSGEPLPETPALDFIRYEGAGIEARPLEFPAAAITRRKTLVLPADHQPEQEEETKPSPPAEPQPTKPKRQWFRRKESGYHETPLNLKIPDWEDLQNKKRVGFIQRLTRLIH